MTTPELAAVFWYYLMSNKNRGATYSMLYRLIKTHCPELTHDALVKRGAQVQRQLQRWGLPFRVEADSKNVIRFHANFVCKGPTRNRDPHVFTRLSIRAVKSGRNWIL